MAHTAHSMRRYVRSHAVARIRTCVDPRLLLLLQYRFEFGLDARLVEVRLEEQCYHEHLPCRAPFLGISRAGDASDARDKSANSRAASAQRRWMVPRTGGMERAWQHSHRVVARHAAAQQ